ncbi:hypothetical protein B0H13DRAFT_1869841 [Mycena leptocephala]|nr:hypothetical protein B0H13DRAFT_1869841 [Mycena leptocephala]
MAELFTRQHWGCKILPLTTPNHVLADSKLSVLTLSQCLKHGIILRGWPRVGDPVNPNKIHDIGSMVKVRDVMKAGTCFWHRLSETEKERKRKKCEKLVGDGVIEVRMRKVRSNKNIKRKNEIYPKSAKS